MTDTDNIGNKYKIAIDPESKKTQGLHVGDIVRRQYLDGADMIYSLMVVTSIGTSYTDSEGNVSDVSWFEGQLLEGDAPQAGENLDFVRVTNLYDTSRSGALYMTASDSDSPYMDVIDGIGRNQSLNYPEDVASDIISSKDVYDFTSDMTMKAEYLENYDGHGRVCQITQTRGGKGNMRQEFNTYIKTYNTVSGIENVTDSIIVSYWVKLPDGQADSTMKVRLGYADATGDWNTGDDADMYDNPDGIIVNMTGEWRYCVHQIPVTHTGRYKRAVFFAFDDNFATNFKIYIAELNIIRLSSLSAFDEASQIRVGKLTGITDPVFGKLDTYGGYFQKLFATNAAHISGTLTAGDENGFGATFYAGKIHCNAFLNSISPLCMLDSDDSTVAIPTSADTTNPTGVGVTYQCSSPILLMAQTSEYGTNKKHVNQQYCFSFWAKLSEAGTLTIYQNGQAIGIVKASEAEADEWVRHKVTFRLNAPDKNDKAVTIKIVPGGNGTWQFAAPQLESGEFATQYQPTDDVVAESDAYGAWLNKGGFGGTIQNPLLMINADDDGAITSRSNGFKINNDGSGHLGNGNIAWNAEGTVQFGDDVKIGWGNLSGDTQSQLKAKSIKIVGSDTFTVLATTDGEPMYSPDYITLELIKNNVSPSNNMIHWYYKKDSEYIEFEDTDFETKGIRDVLRVEPTGDYWGDQESTLEIRVVAVYEDTTYTDTFTLRKFAVEGYTVKISSSAGDTFRNGACSTVLTANVMYQGVAVDEDYVTEHFSYCWKKYILPDMENEVDDWDENGIVRNTKSIEITGTLSGSEAYVCEISTLEGSSFPLYFPILF